MRGEYGRKMAYRPTTPGSPPHARGILVVKLPVRGLVGITPACAGNTFRKPDSFVVTGDHPRMRGEYVVRNKGKSSVEGSPPHARGIHGFSEDELMTAGITPACAGNTMTLFPLSCELRDHPRMRGEYR